MAAVSEALQGWSFIAMIRVMASCMLEVISHQIEATGPVSQQDRRLRICTSAELMCMLGITPSMLLLQEQAAGLLRGPHTQTSEAANIAGKESADQVLYSNDGGQRNSGPSHRIWWS